MGMWLGGFPRRWLVPVLPCERLRHARAWWGNKHNGCGDLVWFMSLARALVWLREGNFKHDYAGNHGKWIYCCAFRHRCAPPSRPIQSGFNSLSTTPTPNCAFFRPSWWMGRRHAFCVLWCLDKFDLRNFCLPPGSEALAGRLRWQKSVSARLIERDVRIVVNKI